MGEKFQLKKLNMEGKETKQKETESQIKKPGKKRYQGKCQEKKIENRKGKKIDTERSSRK